MEDGRRQAQPLIESFCKIEQSLHRLGCRLRSDFETVERLETNFSNQVKDLENLEQRFLRMEKHLHREKTTISVGERRQIVSTSGTESGSPVEQKEEAAEKEETVENLSASLLSSDTERMLKLNAELLERQTEWKREKEELVQKQKQLEEQIRSLQELLSRLPPSGQQRGDAAAKKREAAKRSLTWDVLDKTLFPVVVQCFVALREASSKRRIESSCLLIQRIFRGYVVRKRTQLTHRPKYFAYSQKTIEGSQLVFISDADGQSQTKGTASDQSTSVELTAEHHSPSLTPSSSSSSAAAAAEDDDYDNNNTTKDGRSDIHSLGSDSNRTKPRKTSLTKILQPTKVKANAASSGSIQTNRRSWSVSGTTEWQDPTDTVIHDIRELKQLEMFFADKIAKLSESSGGKSSVYDVVFAEALQEFHSCLTTQLSTATKEDRGIVTDHRYKDLMSSFERVLRGRAQLQLESRNDFPHPLFVNAFRGFIDEFLKKKQNRELPNIKTKKDQHKTNKSKRHSTSSVVEGGEGSSLSGAGLSQLSSSQLVIFVDRLTTAIESKGLCVVGLYRVAGNAAKIKQLIKDMTIAAGVSSSSPQLDFGDRDLHVMTSVLKPLFREMPQPLIPLDLYEDFIQLPDEEEESLAITINKLPEPNRGLLKRLITHLAKVAQNEATNRMSANALAIVFAPCLLRLRSQAQLPESLNHIQKQTTCLQFIIESQMEKMKKDADNLKSSNTDTVKVIDTDTAMSDYINATEAETTAVSEAGKFNADVTDNIISTSRMIDTDTTENDAVNGTDSSTNENDTDSSDVFDSALSVIVSESAVAKGVSTRQHFSVEEKTATMTMSSEGSVVVKSSSAAENEEEKRKRDDEESLSTASEDLDLDINVTICSDDGDDDLEVKLTAQPDEGLSEGPRRVVDGDVASSPASHDEGMTMKNLKSSEDSSKDPQPQQQESPPLEIPANTA